MPPPNLRRVQPTVRAFRAERGIAYTEASLLESYAVVARHLNRVGSWPQARSGAPSPTSSVRPAEPSGSETVFPPTPLQPQPPARARSRQASRRPPACATAAARSSNRRGPTRVRSPRRTTGAASTSDSDAANSSTRRSEGDTSPTYADTAAKSIHAPAGLSARAGARHTHGRAGPARPARINSSVAASRASIPRAHARSRASNSASCAGAQRAGPRSPPAGALVTRTRSHRRGAGHRQPGPPRPRSGLVRQAAAARARRPAGDRCPAASQRARAQARNPAARRRYHRPAVAGLRPRASPTGSRPQRASEHSVGSRSPPARRH